MLKYEKMSNVFKCIFDLAKKPGLLWKWSALYQEALREGIVLLEPVNDATLCEVIRRHLDCHLVPYQDADSVLAQATGEVS